MTLLPQSRPLTRHDLDAMPDDGHRYELIDGTLLVTPAPSRRHQTAQMGLIARLLATCPPHLTLRVAPDVPSLTAWEMVDGSYVQAATATGEESFSASNPFAISLVPARLLD